MSFLAMVGQSKTIEALTIQGHRYYRAQDQMLMGRKIHELGTMKKLNHLTLQSCQVSNEQELMSCLEPENCWEFMPLMSLTLQQCTVSFQPNTNRWRHSYNAEKDTYTFQSHRYQQLHEHPEWGNYQRTNTTFYECGHTDTDSTNLRCKIEGPGPVTNECTTEECIKKGRDELKEHRNKDPHFPRSCVTMMLMDSLHFHEKGPMTTNKTYQYRTTTFFECPHYGLIRIGNHQVPAHHPHRNHDNTDMECHEEDCNGRARAQAWCDTPEGKYCLD
jgi:hypothetical protein